MIGLVQRGGHQEIVAIGTYAQEDDTSAEVAFVVREDFQGMGIASYLLEILEGIAKENDYERFTATVLQDNQAMLSVFKKRYPQAKLHVTGGNEITATMDFKSDGDR
jgi:ribosomal protein S18 acetylase RimI-like enzyme